jgi:plastocyanin
MRVRLLAPLAALAGTAALGAGPALAADRTVAATAANTFDPRVSAVKPGETVTFLNRGGDHNVVWNDGRVPPTPADAVAPEQWPPTVSRTFSRAGRVAATFARRAGRRYARFGAASFSAARGRNSRLVTRAGRRLTPGAYRVTLTLVDANALRSPARSTTVTLP